jgi:Heavy-metal-associated domain
VLKALEGLPGIEKAIVSYPEKRATVTYDQETTNFDQMKEALLKSGYVASFTGNDRQDQNPLKLNPLKNTNFKSEDLVCHCFGYTRNDIEQDYSKNGKSTIMTKIAADKKAGRCECATKNPKGR